MSHDLASDGQAEAASSRRHAALAGSDDAWLGGQPVSFTVDANGRLSSSGACTIGGMLDTANSYSPAVGAQLKLGSGCAVADLIAYR